MDSLSDCHTLDLESDRDESDDDDDDDVKNQIDREVITDPEGGIFATC